MASRGQASEIRHGRAGDEPHTRFLRQAEHVTQPAQRHLLQLHGERGDHCVPGILIPGARQPIRCQGSW